MTDVTRTPLRTGGRLWGPRRVALGLTMRKLEELSGVDKAWLSMAENGKYIPTGEQYDAVERALRAVEQERIA